MHNERAAYARDNLKAAWLLGEMVREPGEFEQVGFEPVDALQRALFMVGYVPLPETQSPLDDAFEDLLRAWSGTRPRHRRTSIKNIGFWVANRVGPQPSWVRKRQLS